MTPLRLAASAAAGVVAVLGVVTLTPSSLGGTTTWVTTQGVSMEPGMHEGDLVLARPRPSYEVGDVVAYPSDTLRQTVVLHRIVEETPDGYVTRGDNNSWLDPDTPTDAEILGAQWVHVPNGGKVVKVFADPLVITTLVLAVALLGWMVSVPARRRRHGLPTHSRGSRTGARAALPGGLAALRPEHVAGLGAVAVALGLFALTQPTSVETTGRPEASASTMTLGTPSRSPSGVTNGVMAKMSACRMASTMTLLSCSPAKTTTSCSPSSCRSCSSSARSGPSP